MKNLDAEMLFEALGDIDEELLEEAYLTDDAEKLKALKKNQKKKIFVFTPLFKRVAAVCVSVTVIIASVLTAKLLDNLKIVVVNNHTSSQQDTAKQPSPDSDTNSSEDSTVPSTPDTPSDDKSSSSSTPNKDNSQSSKPSSSGNSGSSQNQSSSADSGGNSSQGSTPSDNTGSDDNLNEPADSSIKSLDEFNFYVAKKILSDKSLLPISNNLSVGAIQTVELNDDDIYYYEIDEETKITISMVTYFTVNLSDPNGFLAQKLGGTGLVEVAITANSLDNMITFKRGENYYSCLWNVAEYGTGGNAFASIAFSTHKYIEGFNLVKNLEQENYQFFVYFEGSNVARIVCERYGHDGTDAQYVPDSISVVDDKCVVVFLNEVVTMDQLETFIVDNAFKEKKL